MAVECAKRVAMAPVAGRIWNNVFRRYVFRRHRRWVTSGVFDALLETLVELAGRDARAEMIDSTVIRAHHRAVGTKKGLGKQRRLVGRAVVSTPSSTRDAMPRVAHSALFRHRILTLGPDTGTDLGC